MKSEKLKKAVPTLVNYLEKRQAAARNQLPKHLRPLPRWPVLLQMALNAGLFITLCWLMLERDDFMSEAAPAMGLVICLLLLIYSLITALQLSHQYEKAPGHRLTKINFWMMVAAGLMFPAAVAYFLP
jgi:hypothetical protein